MNDAAVRPPLIDIGCNLASPRLLPELPRILEQARAVGVTRQIITGSDLDSNENGLRLAREHGELTTTIGFHPHHADAWRPRNHPALLGAALREPQVVAAGEMGLDYFRTLAKPANQKTCFCAQLALAIAAEKPVFLHVRDAFADFRRILTPYLDELPGAVWHCFTGDAAELDWALSAGLYIGITGWLCDPERGAPLRRIVGQIPDDRLMLESDAPYLTPKTLHPTPRINEPRYLPEILATLARCRGQSTAHVAAITTGNAIRFFRLPALSQHA